MLKSRFETTYVAPSHIIVRDVTTEQRTSVVSARGLAIDELKVGDLKKQRKNVQVMGNDRFIVAYTASTLILADTETGKASEIEWQSGGNEKFAFLFNSNLVDSTSNSPMCA